MNLQMNDMFIFSNEKDKQPDFEDNKMCIVSCDQILSKKNRDTIKCYWKPTKGPFDIDFADGKIRIYGLVEIDTIKLIAREIIHPETTNGVTETLLHLVRDDNADKILGFKVPIKKKLFMSEEYDFTNFVLVELAVGVRENLNIVRYAIIEIIRKKEKVD